MIILEYRNFEDLTTSLEDKTDLYITKAVEVFVNWTTNTIFAFYGRETDRIQDALAREV